MNTYFFYVYIPMKKIKKVFYKPVDYFRIRYYSNSPFFPIKQSFDLLQNTFGASEMRRQPDSLWSNSHHNTHLFNCI